MAGYLISHFGEPSFPELGNLSGKLAETIPGPGTFPSSPVTQVAMAKGAFSGKRLGYIMVTKYYQALHNWVRAKG